MLSRESDLGALEPHAIRNTARRWFAMFVVMGGLAGGGAGLGYFFGVQQTRQDSLAEIERLQQAYGVRIESAASAATNAAEAATTAAEAVGEAAKEAKTAAEAVKKPKPAEGK